MKTREQDLIDITFEAVYRVWENRGNWAQSLDRDQIMGWVASQLRKCGYDTQPMGSSWGVLKQP